MTTENEEFENEIHEEAPKTLASFRERLMEKRCGEGESTEITIKHDSDDKDKKDKKDKDDKKPPFAKKGNDDDDDDDDEDEDKSGDEKKKFKPFSPKGKDVNEETAAAATLHPRGAKGEPLDTSRVEMMKHMVKHMNGLSKTDFTEWFKKSLDRWGPGKDHGVGDNSGKNQASIDSKFGPGPKHKDPMPKLNVREDLNEILGDAELSEEVIEKTATLFEAAVQLRCMMETARLEEEFVEILAEEIDHFIESMTDRLDKYLDYVVENWMAENKIAVESALRTEITTDFIESLKGVFAEHYIDVPEEKIDVLEAMADKVEVLEARLDDVVNENSILKDAVIGGAKQEVVEHIGQGLSQVQMEKFATLAEGIEFEGDFDTYAEKLNIIKENYFGEKPKKQPTSNILEESFEGEEENKPSGYVDPAVNRYAAAISQTVRTPVAVEG